MNEYVSYEDLKTYQGLTTSETGDDALLKILCAIASRMWDGETRRKFYPRTKTRYYDHPEDDSVLKLDDDLLAVSTFTTQNTGETVSSGDYFLLCGNTYNLTPYDRIHLKSSGGRPNLLYSGTPQQANAVTGTWGYHEDWDNAWQDSNDTVQDAGGISASVTTVTVSDADGTDIYGATPRFKVQQTIKIGDEYLYVTAKNTTLNTLTVRRGVNGTTAAAHDNAATITVYRQTDDIEHAVKRLAAWLYGQKDTPYQDRIGMAETGVIVIPEAAPTDVRALAAMYKRRA